MTAITTDDDNTRTGAAEHAAQAGAAEHAAQAGAAPTAPADGGGLVEEDLLVEDVSIDGMCGVY